MNSVVATDAQSKSHCCSTHHTAGGPLDTRDYPGKIDNTLNNATEHISDPIEHTLINFVCSTDCKQTVIKGGTRLETQDPPPGTISQVFRCSLFKIELFIQRSLTPFPHVYRYRSIHQTEAHPHTQRQLSAYWSFIIVFGHIKLNVQADRTFYNLRF